MMKIPRRFALAAALVAAALPLMGAGDWGPWPDIRFVPTDGGQWSFGKLRDRWTRVLGTEQGEDGVYMLAVDDSPRRFRQGDRVAVYYRSMDGSLQGLAGRGEVTEIARSNREMRVRVHLAHLMQFYEHGPWTGWVRAHGWREGFGPGKMSYYLSHENLVGMESEEFRQILAGEVSRGMSARSLMRTWGAPSARGKYDYLHGAQEQWVYQLGPKRRSYAYVDVATRRVTGWHR
jgi:hypothetical protein